MMQSWKAARVVCELLQQLTGSVYASETQLYFLKLFSDPPIAGPVAFPCFAGYPASMTPQGIVPSQDDANLAWKVARQQQLTAWGSDLFCPCPSPMFQLQLQIRDDDLLFVPSLSEVQHAVLGIVDAVLQAGQSVKDLGAKVCGATSSFDGSGMSTAGCHSSRFLQKDLLG